MLSSLYVVAQIEAVVLQGRIPVPAGTWSGPVAPPSHLPAHIVVEPGDAVGVDEVVAHPQPGLHTLAHLDDHIEGVLDTALTDHVWRLSRL